MTDGIIDKHAIKITCSKCGHKIEKTIGWLKANKDMSCPSCGVDITVNIDELIENISGADQALDDLRKTFRSFNK